MGNCFGIKEEPKFNEWKTNDFFSDVLCGRLSLVKAKIDDPTINIHIKSRHGSNIFLVSTKKGHIPIVEYLAQEKNWDVFTKSETGKNALMVACKNGKVTMFKFLMERFDFTNSLADKCNFGYDIYIYAALSNSLDILKYLDEQHGWTHQNFNNSGCNAYLIAASNGSLKSIKYIERRHPDWTINVTNNACKWTDKHCKILEWRNI